MAHDLYRKPVPTFRDHALAPPLRRNAEPSSKQGWVNGLALVERAIVSGLGRRAGTHMQSGEAERSLRTHQVDVGSNRSSSRSGSRQLFAVDLRSSEAVGVARVMAAVRGAVHVVLLALPLTPVGGGGCGGSQAQRNAGEHERGDESLRGLGEHAPISSL